MSGDLMIEAGICSLRRVRASDAEDLAAAANHREVWRNLRDVFPHPYSLADAEAWIGIASTQNPLTNFAITLDDIVVGGIGVRLNEDVYRFSAEVGFWLAPDHWGRGIVTSALGAFAPWIMERQHLRRLYAEIFAWNPASGRVLEKCGFEREGVRRCAAYKDGQFVDAIAYARLESGV